MQDNFDFKSWISQNRVGPYSKDNFNSSKKQINESVEEAMDLTPPKNVYEPEESEQDYYDRAMGLVGLQVKDIIDTLRGDHFEDEEIIDIVRTLIMDYDTAFSGIDEAMDLTPPSPENIYEPDYGTDQQERFLGLGGDKLVDMLHSKNNDVVSVLSDPKAQKAINFLIRDGFEIADIIDVLNSLKDQ